jgi:acyl carrier protein
MERPELEARLRTTLARIVSVPPGHSLDADLFRDLGVDSFRALEFFLAVEDEFQVTLSEDDYVNLRTLGQFLNVLGRDEECGGAVHGVGAQ